MKDDFVVTHVYINEIGILPYHMTFDGGKYKILFRGTKEDCNKFVDNICDSCCQLLNGKKTYFCNDCINHKWYVKKIIRYF